MVLRAQVQAAIDELRAEAAPVRPLGRTEARLAELGVSSWDVKVWAVERGLLAAVARGRVSLLLVEAWAEEHR